jgi:hypothetical protein
MPKASDLSDSLKPLVHRQAVEVRQLHFDRDAEALVERVREALNGGSVGLRSSLGTIVADVADGDEGPFRIAQVTLEVDPGMLTTVVGYLAQLEAPTMRPPRDPGLLDAFAAGRARFDALGCAGCHVPTLELEDPKLDVRFEPDREPKGPPLVINVAKDGDGPKIEPRYAGEVTPYLVHLFSDLKRHDMGEALASPGDLGPEARGLTEELREELERPDASEAQLQALVRETIEAIALGE